MTFLAWDITICVKRNYKITFSVWVRRTLRAATDTVIGALLRVPCNRYLEQVSAFGLLFLWMGKMVFLLLAPQLVSAHGTAAMSGAAMTGFVWQMWAVRYGSLEQRAVATTVAGTAWGLTTLNLMAVYIPKSATHAGRVVIEYALPMCLLLSILCAVQLLVLIREQVVVPSIPEPVAFACYVVDTYEQVFTLRNSVKLYIAKYIDHAYQTWRIIHRRRW